MRKKSFFTLSGTALFLLSAVFLMHSCVKDSFVDTVENKSLEKEMHLNTAKQWFQMESSKHTTIGRSITSRSVGNEGYYSISLRGEPSWKYYAINMNDSLIVTDVDVTDRINQDFVLKNNLNTYKKSGKMPFRRSYTRFVHIENKRTGEQKGFYMTIVPSRYYVKAYNHRIRINTYLKRDKYLGGYVLFHNMEGKFTGGWEYKSGKITGKILPSGVASDNIAKRKLSLIKLPARYEVKPRMYSPYRSRSIGEDIPPDDKIDIFLDEVVVESERWEPDKGLHTDPWQYEYPYGDPDPEMEIVDINDYERYDDWNWPTSTDSPSDIITNKLDQYPCAKEIAESLSKLDNNIADLLNDTFNKNKNFNIHFIANSSLVGGNISGNISYFNYNTKENKLDLEISLNPDILKESTNEYILATMYHEVIHAYLAAEKIKLGENFEKEYPNIIAYYDSDDGTAFGNYRFQLLLEGHDKFGTFIDKLVDAIQSYNRNIPEFTAKALAKEGIIRPSQLSDSEKKLIIMRERTKMHKELNV